MTIATSANSISYTGDGVSTAFAFPYPFIVSTDLKVYVASVLQSSGYSVAGTAPVTGSGTFANGTVTFVSAPAAGAAVLIYCDPDLLQSTSLPPNDPFPSKTVEKMIDKLTLLIQRLTSKFGNALRAPEGETGSFVTGSAASRAGTVYGFDAFGNYAAVTVQAGTSFTYGSAIIDRFTGDGSTTVYTLSANPGAQSNLRVTLAGVMQDDGVDFTWASGTTLTFTTAPPAGVAIRVRQIRSLPMGLNDASVLVYTLPLTGAVATTQSQINSERVSVFRFMSVAQIAAVSSGLGAAAAECSTALQAAMDSGAAELYFPRGLYLINKPLLIKSGGTQNLTFLGESRVGTIIAPTATDISVAPLSVNALLINQQNDAKFTLKRMRFNSNALGYTGVILYAKEGGGGDSSAQCIFSGSIEECWFDPSSTNAGVFRGGLQNFRVLNNTFEFCKGCFFFDGVGVDDVLFDNNALSQCYDAFIDATTDAVDRRLVTVRGLHAYGHLRGALINAQNARGWDIAAVSLRADSSIVSATVGLFNFKNSSDIRASDFGLESVAPYGLATDAIILSGVTGKFAHGIIRGADHGVRIDDATAIDVQFTDVDVLASRTNSLRTTGALTGRLRITGGNWSDSQSSGIVNAAAAGALDVQIYNARVNNAGLGAIAGARNLDLTTNGNVRIYGSTIGQDNVLAIAATYVQVAGSGTFRMVDTDWLGTPPSSYTSGTITFSVAQPSNVRTITNATDTTLDSDLDLIFNRAGTVTETLPAPAAYLGRELVLRTIQAQTVVSASSNVVPLIGGSAGTAILAATAGKWARLKSDGTAWQIMAGN